MMAFGAGGRGLKICHFFRRIVVENALAGITDDGLSTGADFVVSLWAKHNAASHTFLIADFRDAAAAKFRDALEVSQQVIVNTGASLVAFGAPFREKLFVFGSALAGLFFFFFDLGSFGFEFGLRGFDFLVARVGIDHHLQNLVFVSGDLFFSELDFVQQRLVLIVCFNVERLVAILGNFSAEIVDGGIVLAAGGLVGLDGGLGFFQLSFGAGQFLLDDGDALGEFGNLVLQTSDFRIDALQFQQILYVGKH